MVLAGAGLAMYPPGFGRSSAPPPQDLTALTQALETQAFRIALLERRVATQAARGPQEATTPDGSRAVLTLLALQDMQEALDRGAPLTEALVALQAVLGPAGGEPLAILALHAPGGVASLARLEADYATLAPLIDEQVTRRDGPLLGRLQRIALDMAADLHVIERPTPAPLRRAAEKVSVALRAGDLALALREAAPLQADPATGDILFSWLAAVRARVAVQEAMQRLRRGAWQSVMSTP